MLAQATSLGDDAAMDAIPWPTPDLPWVVVGLVSALLAGLRLFVSIYDRRRRRNKLG
jgi:hypothetical protein